jgi:outer membrane protein TolC
VLRAQVELTRAEETRARRETEAETRLARLNRLVGRALDTPLGETPELQLGPVAGDAQEWNIRAQAESPELREATIGVESGGLSTDLARTLGAPAFQLQAGYMNRGGLDPMWQAGLGVTWPFLSRSRERAAVAEAEQEERRREHALAAMRRDLELRTRQRLVQLAGLARVARLYTQGILPQGRLALDAALAQYRAGRLPLSAVLEALTSLADDRSAHLEDVARHESLKATLLSWSLEDDEPAMGEAKMGRARTMPAAGGSGGPGAMETSPPGAPPPGGGMGEGR